MVEVFLVIVIISTVSAIAVPRFGNFLAGTRLAGATRRIIVDLSLAQRRAKSTGVSSTASFTPASRTLELVGLSDPDHPGQPYIVSLGEEPYQLSSMAVNFNGLSQVVFDAYGVPDSGGTITIIVGEYQRTITVDPDTGRATASATILAPGQPINQTATQF